MNPATPTSRTDLASLVRQTAREIWAWTLGCMGLSVVLKFLVGVDG